MPFKLQLKTISSHLSLEDKFNQVVSERPEIVACGELTLIKFSNKNYCYVRSNIINTITINEVPETK